MQNICSRKFNEKSNTNTSSKLIQSYQIIEKIVSSILVSKNRHIYYFRNIVYFINFRQKTIFAYVNEIHSYFLKHNPFITGHISTIAIHIIVFRFQQSYNHKKNVCLANFHYEFHALNSKNKRIIVSSTQFSQPFPLT